MRKSLLFVFLPGLLLGGCKTTNSPKYESRSSHKPNAVVDWSPKADKGPTTPEKIASDRTASH